MPPNIVVAFADDWGRYASAYARHSSRSGAAPGSDVNSLLSTPHFDRVAAEGALCLNALVPAPSCTPCRSSLLSGRYFWQTGLGAILDGARWDEGIPSFPLELEARAGYAIGHTYKVWSPGRTVNAPIGGCRTQYVQAGNDFNHFSHFVTANAAELGVEGAKQQLYEETRQNMRAFLDERAADKPFFYFWGPSNTHRSWERGSGKALWGLEPDALRGRLPGFLPDAHDVREDVCDYLGECQAVDGGLGVLLEELEAIGELDNTLLIVSGDHGIPGIPRAKCNLYDIGCEVALAVRWPGRVAPGRIIEDFVNLMDLAPTCCEAGGLRPPASMTARSLLPLLLDPEQRSGQVEPGRSFVVTGRERHVALAREGFLPYPQRCLRTRDFIYIVNFEPDRWPTGDPRGIDEPGAAPPDPDLLEHDLNNGYYFFGDMDPSPTKAYMVLHREDLDVEPLYRLAFGKRPREELYDLRTDPDYMHNVAADASYEHVRAAMERQLLGLLEEQNDPRLVGPQPCKYELVPYAAGWLEPDNRPADISYEEARARMEAEARWAMVPRQRL